MGAGRKPAPFFWAGQATARRGERHPPHYLMVAAALRRFRVTSVRRYDFGMTLGVRVQNTESVMRCICLVALSCLAAGGQVLAAGETCTSYLTTQREKMLVAAMACEGTPTQQQSVRPQAERERNGDKVM